MSFFGFLMLLLIASICGGIGQSIGGYKLGSGGCLMSAVVGFVGALLGTWMARELGFPELWTIHIDGEPFPIIWSIIGGAFLTAIWVSFLKEGKKAPYNTGHQKQRMFLSQEFPYLCRLVILV